MGQIKNFKEIFNNYSSYLPFLSYPTVYDLQSSNF